MSKDNSNVAEAASEVMWHLVTHADHGYSQPNRHGTGGPHTGNYYISTGGEVITVLGWWKVRIHSGDYDCSEACIDCYGFLGIDVGGATYTGNELECLTRTGLFKAYRAGSVTPKDGDILLRSGHTEMVINEGQWQAGFRRSENHSITGRTGDQDGYESTYSALDMSKWTWVIRYVGPDVYPPSQENDTKEDVVTQQEKEDIANLVVARIKDVRDDPTGRNQNLSIFDHVKWIGAAVQEISSKLTDVLDALKELKSGKAAE